jgi:hypothetical protein
VSVGISIPSEGSANLLTIIVAVAASAAPQTNAVRTLVRSRGARRMVT